MGSLLGGAFSGAAGVIQKKKGDDEDRKARQKMSNTGRNSATLGGSNDEAGQTAGSFKRGGKVRRTGKARVHKGERVLTAKQARRYEGKRGAKR